MNMFCAAHRLILTCSWKSSGSPLKWQQCVEIHYMVAWNSHPQKTVHPPIYRLKERVIVQIIFDTNSLPYRPATMSFLVFFLSYSHLNKCESLHLTFVAHSSDLTFVFVFGDCLENAWTDFSIVCFSALSWLCVGEKQSAAVSYSSWQEAFNKFNIPFKIADVRKRPINLTFNFSFLTRSVFCLNC